LSAGLRSLAVAFPDEIRTNDHYRERCPGLVASAEQRTLAKLWAAHEGEASAFDRAFEPYVHDPFRGTLERRALGPDEPILPVEVRAARDALAAAELQPADIDMVLASSFLPDQVGVGNAVFIARELGIAGAAWNIETACSSATAGLQLATSLVVAGQASHVLVVISCAYSRVADPADTFGWFLGDGCAAFVVGACPAGEGRIAAKTIHTAETCGAFRYALDLDERGRPWVRIEAGDAAGRSLRDTALPYLRRCVDGAITAAGCRLEDIDFFAFNTPTAWYADFCTKALGIPPERTINTYPLYANMGPVLWPVNLHHAASLGRPTPGDLVLVYSVGSVSSAGAVIMRWGRVGLGPLPERVTRDRDAVARLLRVG
jgi:3-oxoacyl-[acyl-carrier-protein] synthase III